MGNGLADVIGNLSRVASLVEKMDEIERVKCRTGMMDLIQGKFGAMETMPPRESQIANEVIKSKESIEMKSVTVLVPGVQESYFSTYR